MQSAHAARGKQGLRAHRVSECGALRRRVFLLRLRLRLTLRLAMRLRLRLRLRLRPEHEEKGGKRTQTEEQRDGE